MEKYYNKKYKKKYKNKNYMNIILMCAILIIVIAFIECSQKNEIEEIQVFSETVADNTSDEVFNNETEDIIDITPVEKNIDDWKLIIANRDNTLPDDFNVELSNIDKIRKFDSRAISFLDNMINDMQKDGITNIWVQSAFRSIEEQEKVYNDKVNEYLRSGLPKEEAERLTSEYINKPGQSDHNLGLAVDFNNVKENFENTKAFTWLNLNAANYGFILRYPKDKENITNISYEPWHWRFVGQDHAKKMKELNMCLEEYVEYLKYDN